MASKPETLFIRKVHRHLPANLHHEKMHNAYRGGTPDVWYSGDRADMWVEYKWLATLPKGAPVRVYSQLSHLQMLWLAMRLNEGRNVCVVLGSPEGMWIYENGAWLNNLTPETIRNANLRAQDVAAFITERTTHVPQMAVQGSAVHRALIQNPPLLVYVSPTSKLTAEETTQTTAATEERR